VVQLHDLSVGSNRVKTNRVWRLISIRSILLSLHSSGHSVHKAPSSWEVLQAGTVSTVQSLHPGLNTAQGPIHAALKSVCFERLRPPAVVPAPSYPFCWYRWLFGKLQGRRVLLKRSCSCSS